MGWSNYKEGWLPRGAGEILYQTEDDGATHEAYWDNGKLVLEGHEEPQTPIMQWKPKVPKLRKDQVQQLLDVIIADLDQKFDGHYLQIGQYEETDFNDFKIVSVPTYNDITLKVDYKVKELWDFHESGVLAREVERIHDKVISNIDRYIQEKYNGGFKDPGEL